MCCHSVICLLYLRFDCGLVLRVVLVFELCYIVVRSGGVYYLRLLT